MGWIVVIVDLWNSGHSAPHPDPYKGAGGLHLRGGSNRVDVSGNQITGGASHGITLGGAFAGEAEAPDGTDAAPAATAPPVTVATSGTEAGRAVDEAGQPVAALALKLVSATGATVYTTVTTGTGRFVFVTPGGTYTLVAADGFAVDSVGYDEQKLILVKLRRVTPVTGPDQEPLSEIRILRNDILGMDLCGIGFPLTTSEAARPLMPHSASVASLAGWLSDLIAPYELVATTSLLRDLEIRENRISGNLRVPVTREWRKAVTRIAPAGICLPLVEGVVIAANRITSNGFDASYPAAGLFIGYGEAIAITDNHIEENGILSEAYDYEAVEGLRGGVIIRMASARVTGGRDDQPARPAVDLRDNHIDQPVGRAITICAYGPVSCIGNHLNSEREGRMGLADRAIGGVLIANLGGLHRHFYARQKGGFNVRNEAAGGVLGALAAQSAVEGVLPGGEVMFSANRVRTGGGHRSLLSQLIVTCDDISYNGNQAAMLGSNVTFGNLVAAGMTLRVTDNRFRETAEMVVLSALSRCFSLAGGALPYPMNATAQNQADHCIFALGEDSSSAPPVISTPNQVVFSQSCPTHPAEQMAYLREAMRYLLFAELSTGGPRDTGDGDGRVIVTEAVEASARFQEALVFDKAGALERARREASADAAILLRRESELLARRLAADLAEEQSRLAKIVPAPEPAPGARLIEGRVTDTTGRAVAGAAVQLVDATGRALGITAKADQAGYYALELSADQAAKLALRSGVAISISTEAVVGKAQLVPLGTLLTSKEARLRADLATEHLAAFRPTLTGVKLSRADGGTPDLKPDLKPEQPEEKPLDPGPALTDVKGIGAALADKLRLAGIGDAKALLAASDAKLTGILGSKAATLRDSAREAIALALKQRKGG